MRQSPLRYLHRPSSATICKQSNRMRNVFSCARIVTAWTYETQRTDFGGKGRGGTDLTTGRPQVDDLDFIRVLWSVSDGQHRGGVHSGRTNLGAMATGRERGRR